MAIQMGHTEIERVLQMAEDQQRLNGASLLRATMEGNFQELKGILDRRVDLEFTHLHGSNYADICLILFMFNGHDTVHWP